ncbi:MAG: glycosyltransferase [Eubacteriaceae bacterium]|nr:glycosyltransferase [Eubacteriaceae bacterium]
MLQQTDDINVAVLIPSLNPSENLIAYIKDLVNAGIKKIIVVDDGSKEDAQPYFKLIEKKYDGIVLHHDVNKGKGRALKTGFNYFINTFSYNEMAGIVTADSDGQHSAQDTVNVAKRLIEENNKIILGTRNFNQSDVPLKSRWGNKITTAIFALLYSKKINDTQTGLRGIPYKFINNCLFVKGERFEYETGMLISAVREQVDIAEEKIQTIYIDKNDSSHFNPVKDSLFIYFMMLSCFFKFSLSGIISFGVDIGLFTLFSSVIFNKLTTISMTIFFSTLFARVISSLFNYMVNKNIVFNNASNMKNSIIKYYILCALQLLASWLLVTLVYNKLNINLTAIKVLIDFALFFISFQIQRRWVFVRDNQNI